MKINEIETPALILDKQTFEYNLERMDQLLEGTTMKLRPHYKSNKCAEIAKLHAETEFEKYRIIQDRLFMSDYDKYLLELEENAKK